MNSKTVLIVEDQFEMRAINTIFLQQHGYDVVAVGNGEEGVRVAREHKPDVIVMDVSVPGIDGLCATKELKGDPETLHIPILVLTAHTYGSVGQRAREAGCDAFLRKPCDPQRLLKEIQQHIGDAGRAAN